MDNITNFENSEFDSTFEKQIYDRFYQLITKLAMLLNFTRHCCGNTDGGNVGSR